MASTSNKKEPERLSVMVPRDCKDDIEFIIAQTGIKSNGELFRLMLTRYRDDFISAYNQFFAPTNYQSSQAVEIELKPDNVSTNLNKPATGVDF